MKTNELMKAKKKLGIATIIALAAVNFVSLGIAATTAAFLSYELNSQTIEIDLGYSKYFGSADVNSPADGTQANPYLIKNSDHLRNLSYLVNLGVLGPNHYFQIPQPGFTYSGAPLMPIGSDSQPFMSHLEGEKDTTDFKIVPIIKNLVVEGNNLPDVGMFGYIANNGYISDFILQDPLIKSYEKLNDGTYRPANSGFDSQMIDENPLRNLKASNGTPLFGRDNCKKINLTLPTNFVPDVGKILETFKIDVSGIKTEVEKHGLKLFPIVSDTNLVYQNDTNNPFSFGTKHVIDIPTKPNSTQSQEGKYLTVSIAASGISNINGKNRFSTIILERFKLYFQYSTDPQKDGILADPNDYKFYDKIVYPDVYMQETTLEDENQDQVSGYNKYDDSRSLYVGVLAGHFDGYAERIGVLNPKLDIQRPFVSSSLLFGKTIEDTNKRTLSHEEFSTENLGYSDPNSPNLTFKFIDQYMIEYKRRGNKGKYFSVANADREIGNNYVSNIYEIPKNSPADEPNAGYTGTILGFTNSAQNIIRIYGPNVGKDSGSLQHKHGVVGVVDQIVATGGVVPTNAISIQEPLDVFYNKPERRYIDKNKTTLDDIGFLNMKASNAIQMWVSAQHTRSRVNDWFNGSVDFYLDCEIDYLYFDDLTSEINLSDKQDDLGFNRLQIVAGEKGIRKHRVGSGKTRRYYYERPRNTSLADLDAALYRNEIIRFEPVPDVADSPTTVANKYYPFALIENTETGESGYKSLTLKRSGDLKSASSVTGFTPNKLRFSLAANKEYMAKKEKIKTGMFPIFFMGLMDRSGILDGQNNPTHNNYRFDILGMKITLSNKRGNIDSSTGTVDYIAPPQANGKPILPYRNNNVRLFNTTGVKISAQTIENTQFSIDKPTDLNYFATISSQVPKNLTASNNSYLIKVTRDIKTNKVTVTYNPYNIGNTTNIGYIIPEDTPGFKAATYTIDSGLVF